MTGYPYRLTGPIGTRTLGPVVLQVPKAALSPKRSSLDQSLGEGGPPGYIRN